MATFTPTGILIGTAFIAFPSKNEKSTISDQESNFLFKSKHNGLTFKQVFPFVEHLGGYEAKKHFDNVRGLIKVEHQRFVSFILLINVFLAFFLMIDLRVLKAMK